MSRYETYQFLAEAHSVQNGDTPIDTGPAYFGSGQLDPAPLRSIARRRFMERLALSSMDVVLLWASLLNGLALAGLFNLAPINHPNAPYAVANYLGEGLIMSIFVLIAIALRGHYSSRNPFWQETRDLAMILTIAALLHGFLSLLIDPIHSVQQAPIVSLMVGWGMALLLIPIGRRVSRALLTRAGLWTRHILLIGSGDHVTQAEAALLSEPYFGYKVRDAVPFSDLDMDTATPSLQELIVEKGGSIKDVLLEIMDRVKADSVVLAPTAQEFEKVEMLARHLHRARIKYALIPPVKGLAVMQMQATGFYSHDMLMLTTSDNLSRPVSRLLKRTFDLVVASTALLVLSPFFLVASYKIRQDGGTAFFGHRRVGQNGDMFYCLKFRTMVMNAEEKLQDVLANDPEKRAEWDRDQKLRDDPRITGLGKFLRDTSLDELPQLINVLKGEMSLVGLRPVVLDELLKYGDDVEYYLDAQPGITGLWQVSGRNNLSYERRVQLDAWYVRNWTLWQDITILLKTVPAVWLQKGVY